MQRYHAETGEEATVRSVLQVLCEWDSYIPQSAQRAQSCSCRCQRSACCSFNQVCSSLLLAFAYTNHLLVLPGTLPRTVLCVSVAHLILVLQRQHDQAILEVIAAAAAAAAAATAMPAETCSTDVCCDCYRSCLNCCCEG